MTAASTLRLAEAQNQRSPFPRRSSRPSFRRRARVCAAIPRRRFRVGSRRPSAGSAGHARTRTAARWPQPHPWWSTCAGTVRGARLRKRSSSLREVPIGMRTAVSGPRRGGGWHRARARRRSSERRPAGARRGTDARDDGHRHDQPGSRAELRSSRERPRSASDSPSRHANWHKGRGRGQVRRHVRGIGRTLFSTAL